eukprot:scaffold62885_cov18-Prasinocladus_malaysianus.AAC.1
MALDDNQLAGLRICGDSAAVDPQWNLRCHRFDQSGYRCKAKRVASPPNNWTEYRVAKTSRNETKRDEAKCYYHGGGV